MKPLGQSVLKGPGLQLSGKEGDIKSECFLGASGSPGDVNHGLVGSGGVEIAGRGIPGDFHIFKMDLGFSVGAVAVEDAVLVEFELGKKRKEELREKREEEEGN